MTHLVSIITPLYNAEEFIGQTIKSVIAQTYTHWELLIVNDQSTDNSLQIAEQFAKEDARIKVINLEHNSGVSKARNKAIKNAQGTFIAFLDADDLWDEKKLELQIQFMLKNKISLSYTNYRKINQDGSPRGNINIKPQLNYTDLLKANLMGCLTVVYNKDYLGKRYFVDYQKSEDYILWLEILKQGHLAYGINQCLASYRVFPNSRSSNKIEAVKTQWKIYREVEHLSFVKAFYFFIIYLIIGYKRYRK